jgi:hypothetical protein
MKKIVKKFNSLIERTIFNVKNKTNSNFKISSFNKYSIVVIGLLFSCLFYLLVPTIYSKTWVQSSIESKIFNEFKINLSSSANISYRILPAPHFLIKNSKILLNNDKHQKSIADIKNLKVFISKKNFLDKEKMNIINVVIDNANFSLLRSDLKILNKSSNNKFSNKKIKIKNSNIFFKDKLDKVITIIKISKATLFFDDKKLLNLFSLKGEIYAIPFIFNFKNQNDPIKNKEINFNAKTLKLNIFNKLNGKKNNSNSGRNIISFLNSTMNTKYNFEEKLIIFKSENSNIKNSNFTYSGDLSIDPFDLNLNIELGNYKISKLFNFNSIIIEFIKSKILFNDNISVNSSITANTNKKNEIFQSAKIIFRIINGKINIDNTRLVNDKIGSLELDNSNLFLENNYLFLNTNIRIIIKDSDRLFSFLQTNKKSRKNIKNILINIDYDFLRNKIKFNNVKIDNNKVGDQFLTALEALNDNRINNLTKSRRIINQLFDIYEG